jgi:hypothetical protein
VLNESSQSPIPVTARQAFVKAGTNIRLGLGLSPLPQDSGTIFVSRVVTVLIASLYTVGIASVLRGLFLGPMREV